MTAQEQIAAVEQLFKENYKMLKQAKTESYANRMRSVITGIVLSLDALQVPEAREYSLMQEVKADLGIE